MGVTWPSVKFLLWQPSQGFPNPSPRLSILPEGLTTETYYREGIQSKISKGKEPMSQSLEDTRR